MKKSKLISLLWATTLSFGFNAYADSTYTLGAGGVEITGGSDTNITVNNNAGNT